MAIYFGSGASFYLNFREEISKIIYGCGNRHSPDPATIYIIEMCVHKQQTRLLKEAHDISVRRGSNTVSNYEYIYMMYKNRNVLKLKRLHDFQVSQDKLEKMNVFSQLEHLLPVGEVYYESDDDVKRRRRTHIKIIKKISGIKELQKINHNYHGHKPKQARCISFRTNAAYRVGLGKFKRWVDPYDKYEVTYSGLEVMCFIAYETVADIVEAILLSRKSKVNDQFNNGVLLHRPITMTEVLEVLTLYFTPNYWLNRNFFKNMGMAYIANHI